MEVVALDKELAKTDWPQLRRIIGVPSKSSQPPSMFFNTLMNSVCSKCYIIGVGLKIDEGVAYYACPNCVKDETLDISFDSDHWRVLDKVESPICPKCSGEDMKPTEALQKILSQGDYFPTSVRGDLLSAFICLDCHPEELL